MSTAVLMMLIKLHTVGSTHLIHKVVEVESTSNHIAMSTKGAVGLMQVTPIALKEVVINRHHLPPKCSNITAASNMLNSAANLLAGSCYLYLMTSKFSSVRLGLAAYNAGPSRVIQHINLGRPLPPETEAYLNNFRGFYATKVK